MSFFCALLGNVLFKKEFRSLLLPAFFRSLLRKNNLLILLVGLTLETQALFIWTTLELRM